MDWANNKVASGMSTQTERVIVLSRWGMLILDALHPPTVTNVLVVRSTVLAIPNLPPRHNKLNIHYRQAPALPLHCELRGHQRSCCLQPPLVAQQACPVS